MEPEAFRHKRIAVIGLGYVGRNMYRFLEAAATSVGYTVSGFSRHNLDQIQGYEFDYVFNCAGNTGDFRSRIIDTVESNTGLTAFLLKHVSINEAYVALSSTRIYGFSPVPVSGYAEDDVADQPADHLSIDYIYDGSKRLMESLIWNMRNELKCRTTICRLSNVFGRFRPDEMDESTYFKLMLACAARSEEIVVRQPLDSVKGYVFIDDAIDGMLRAALYPESEIFNICSGYAYSLREVLSILGVRYTHIDGAPPSYSKVSIAKAEALLNFRPAHLLHTIDKQKFYES